MTDHAGRDVYADLNGWHLFLKARHRCGFVILMRIVSCAIVRQWYRNESVSNTRS